MSRKIGKKKRTVAIEKYHPMIATPAYDGKVDVDYAVSVAEAAFVSPLFGVQVTMACMGNGAFIDLARNIFVKRFLEDEKDCTHLFFIDSDLKFPAKDFIGLVRSGQPICAGVYCRRQEGESYPIKFSQHPEQGGLWVDMDEQDLPWIMADRVPTGFLCIRRDVVEEMAADAKQLTIVGQEGKVPRLFYTYLDEEDRFIGEDFAFCDDYLKKYNKRIPVFANIDFIHAGYVCNLSAYLEKKIEEEDKLSEAVKEATSSAA